MADDSGIVIREAVAEGISPLPDHDLTGRQVPRRSLGVFAFLRAFPACASQFIEIPGEFWSQDVNGEGYTTAAIACPCGEEPHVEIGCMETCACERVFLYGGSAVFVANSPKTKAPTIPLWQRIAAEWSAKPAAERRQ